MDATAGFFHGDPSIPSSTFNKVKVFVCCLFPLFLFFSPAPTKLLQVYGCIIILYTNWIICSLYIYMYLYMITNNIHILTHVIKYNKDTKYTLPQPFIRLTIEKSFQPPTPGSNNPLFRPNASRRHAAVPCNNCWMLRSSWQATRVH